MGGIVFVLLMICSCGMEALIHCGSTLLWESVRKGLDLDHDLKGTVSSQVVHEVISECGGRKQKHELHDGNFIESVIIPHEILPRTTLCVSSQIGCDRGCLFCATGKMGLVRNLSADEIISQVYWALHTVRKHKLSPLKNIVFMGMGDVGMNLNEVSTALDALVDHKRFDIAPRRITLSTVGPTPDVFDKLAQLPGGKIAWSLHSAIPSLRRKLVPSSRFYEPVELRDGLMRALLTHKSRKHQSAMIAITLIKGINCAPTDAVALADFLAPLRDNGIKINVDMIPLNDIGVAGLEKPDDKDVVAFKEVLWRAGISHSVRFTRGTEQASACGMLATTPIRRATIL